MTWLWVLLIVLGVLAVGIATGPVMAAMKRERAERGTRNAPAHEPSEYVGEGGASVAILAASSGAVSGQKDGEILVSPLSAPGAAAHTTLADPGQPRPVPQVEDAPAQRLLDSAAEREALAHAREAVASEREAAASTLDAADRQSAALAGAQLRDAAAEATPVPWPPTCRTGPTATASVPGATRPAGRPTTNSRKVGSSTAPPARPRTPGPRDRASSSVAVAAR
jgi:hypothetical protein